MTVNVGTSVYVNGQSLVLTEEDERTLLRKLVDKVSLTQPDFWKELKNAR